MRCRLPALTLALALAAPASGATRNFGVEDFDRIRVEGPYKVTLKTGVAPFARASGSPAALDGIAIKVEGRTLVVRHDPSNWGGYPGQDNGPVEIAAGTHELSSATLSGAGSLAIDKVKALSFDLSAEGSGAASVAAADVDQLRVGVVGTASATLAGRAGKVTALVRGIAALDASALAAKDASLSTEGSASIKANVSNSVSIDGSGPATIALSGKPACTSRTSGSATVTGCRVTH
jgi:hypothetical protein